nr:tetratricopeptide repeat protein [uncultured Anaeromusa sp.]
MKDQNSVLVSSGTEREQELRQNVQKSPQSPAAYYRLGCFLNEDGNLSEAANMLRKAIALDSGAAPFYQELGLVLGKAGMLEKAAELLRWALVLKPEYPEAINNLGVILRRAGELREAETCFRRALSLKPLFADAYNNLGLVLAEEVQDQEEALQCFRKAVKLEPDNANVQYNLGLALKSRHEFKEAEACLQQALQLSADFIEADFSLAELYLLQGRYELGWTKYDDLRLLERRHGQLPLPHWQGECLQGKKILLYADQGYGDTLQFLRYARKVAAMATETGLLVQKPLERLVRQSLPECRVWDSSEILSLAEYDLACPFLSLPHWFHTKLESMPQENSYVQPEAEEAAAWAEKLRRIDSKGKLRIGAVWAGNAAHSNDKNRSMPLTALQSLFQQEEFCWVSLQVGERANDIKKLPVPAEITDVSLQLKDFATTAAVIANLELVLTIDSAVAHLAGAMGKKTWLMLPFNPDWRWLLEREDSPWYLSMRLFRQQRIGDWAEVVINVKKALEAVKREQK